MFVVYSLVFVLFAILIIPLVFSQGTAPRICSTGASCDTNGDGVPDFEVTLTSPENNHKTKNEEVPFSFKVKSLNPIALCQLILDDSPVRNIGGESITINTQIPITKTVNEGTHEWTVRCDDSTNTVQAPPFTFTIDKTPPSITLNNPTPGELLPVGQTEVTFEWTASDIDNDIKCELFVDGTSKASALTGTILGVLMGAGQPTQKSFTNTQTISEIGAHKWKVKCSDSLGNERTTDEQDFTLTQGETTITATNLAPPQNYETAADRLLFVGKFESNKENLKEARLKILKPDGSVFKEETRQINPASLEYVAIDVRGLTEIGDYKWTFTGYTTDGESQITNEWTLKIKEAGGGTPPECTPPEDGATPGEKCDKLNVMEEFFHGLPDIVQGLILAAAAIAGIIAIVAILSKLGGLSFV